MGICRRQVFWIAKQILQLGMGDAVDDWLMSRIQCLMQEDMVVASIKAVENVFYHSLKISFIFVLHIFSLK